MPRPLLCRVLLKKLRVSVNKLGNLIYMDILDKGS